MINLEVLRDRLQALTIFKSFEFTDFGEAVICFVDDIGGYGEIESYANLCREIYRNGGDLGLLISDYIRSGENLYIENYLEGRITKEMDNALKEELKTLQMVSDLTSKELIDIISPKKNLLPEWANTKVDVKKEFASSLKNLPNKGYGIFAESIMFKVRDGELVPVKNADYQTLDQLYGYERERNQVLKNTAALASGKVASNVLLYGDAGTGKSTTVKACAAHYQSKGVRLVEFDKNQVHEIPEIAEKLASSPLKFIFFIDDLTFTNNDDDYYALKGILEGNVSGTAPNILIYATSNRRHLLKESMADRQGDDLHLNDTLQETMSLSSRFGLTITFSKPEKDLFLSIVENLAREQGILSAEKAGTPSYNKKLEDIVLKAEAFAIRANGRSPRTAKQFIVLLKNEML